MLRKRTHYWRIDRLYGTLLQCAEILSDTVTQIDCFAQTTPAQM